MARRRQGDFLLKSYRPGKPAQWRAMQESRVLEVLERTVTLLEIVRTYVEIHTNASYIFGMFTNGPLEDFDEQDVEQLIEKLMALRRECDRAGLVMTVKSIDAVFAFF